MIKRGRLIWLSVVVLCCSLSSASSRTENIATEEGSGNHQGKEASGLGQVGREGIEEEDWEQKNDAEEGGSEKREEDSKGNEEEQWEKGYDLPVDAGERKEAEEDCIEMMGLISHVYIDADKGDSLNVVLSDKTIHQMKRILKKTGNPVTDFITYSSMANHEKFRDFLAASLEGIPGSCVLYEIYQDGGIGRKKYIFDGGDMYGMEANASWGDDNVPGVSAVSCSRLKEWRYSEKGWFCYEYCVPEYPEVTEMVDGNCMIRVKPMSRKLRKYSKNMFSD